ncbi:MAG: HNH endonuclease [Campylobacterales bacterium]|nr:HNH endonuclease [Campylobacterales bacterium]
MRPVNKGAIPKNADGSDKNFTDYKQAKDDLRTRLGSFCSYCEMNIDNQPDIEHISPKSKKPELEKEWNNFLVACKSCNIIKDNNNEDRDGFVFPDTHNTAFLYNYSILGVSVKDNLPNDVKILATATFNLVQLNRKLDTSSRTDDRALARLHAWDKAQDALKDFLELLPVTSTPEKKHALVNLAANTCNGFFSLWIQIFKDYPEVKKAILENVRGTAIECYDESFNPKENLRRSDS